MVASETRSPATPSILDLVVGNYGKTSNIIRSLIYRLVGVKTGLPEGAPIVEDAVAAKKYRSYRSLSVVVHGERAGLILDGLPFFSRHSTATLVIGIISAPDGTLTESPTPRPIPPHVFRRAGVPWGESAIDLFVTHRPGHA